MNSRFLANHIAKRAYLGNCSNDLDKISCMLRFYGVNTVVGLNTTHKALFKILVTGQYDLGDLLNLRVPMHIKLNPGEDFIVKEFKNNNHNIDTPDQHFKLLGKFINNYINIDGNITYSSSSAYGGLVQFNGSSNPGVVDSTSTSITSISSNTTIYIIDTHFTITGSGCLSKSAGWILGASTSTSQSANVIIAGCSADWSGISTTTPITSFTGGLAGQYFGGKIYPYTVGSNNTYTTTYCYTKGVINNYNSGGFVGPDSSCIIDASKTLFYNSSGSSTAISSYSIQSNTYPTSSTSPAYNSLTTGSGSYSYYDINALTTTTVNFTTNRYPTYSSGSIFAGCGGIVGSNCNGCTINYCSSLGSISGASSSYSGAGGIVGPYFTNGTISNCTSNGIIGTPGANGSSSGAWNGSNGSQGGGGIVGDQAGNVTVSNCQAYGSIIVYGGNAYHTGIGGNGGFAGGICGYNCSGSITGCTYYGNIYSNGGNGDTNTNTNGDNGGDGYTAGPGGNGGGGGGIVTDNFSGTSITKCYFAGNVIQCSGGQGGRGENGGSGGTYNSGAEVHNGGYGGYGGNGGVGGYASGIAGRYNKANIIQCGFKNSLTFTNTGGNGGIGGNGGKGHDESPYSNGGTGKPGGNGGAGGQGGGILVAQSNTGIIDQINVSTIIITVNCYGGNGGNGGWAGDTWNSYANGGVGGNGGQGGSVPFIGDFNSGDITLINLLSNITINANGGSGGKGGQGSSPSSSNGDMGNPGAGGNGNGGGNTSLLGNYNIGNILFCNIQNITITANGGNGGEHGQFGSTYNGSINTAATPGAAGAAGWGGLLLGMYYGSTYTSTSIITNGGNIGFVKIKNCSLSLNGGNGGDAGAYCNTTNTSKTPIPGGTGGNGGDGGMLCGYGAACNIYKCIVDSSTINMTGGNGGAGIYVEGKIEYSGTVGGGPGGPGGQGGNGGGLVGSNFGGTNTTKSFSIIDSCFDCSSTGGITATGGQGGQGGNGGGTGGTSLTTPGGIGGNGGQGGNGGMLCGSYLGNNLNIPISIINCYTKGLINIQGGTGGTGGEGGSGSDGGSGGQGGNGGTGGSGSAFIGSNFIQTTYGNAPTSYNIINCFTTANINFCGGIAGTGGKNGSGDEGNTAENMGLSIFSNALDLVMFNMFSTGDAGIAFGAVAGGVMETEGWTSVPNNSSSGGKSGYSGQTGQGAMILGANCNNISLANIIYSGAILTGGTVIKNSDSNMTSNPSYSYISGCFWGYSSTGNFYVNSIGTSIIENLGTLASSTSSTYTYNQTSLSTSTSYSTSNTLFSNSFSNMWATLSSAGAIKPYTIAYYMLGAPNNSYCSVGGLYDIPTNNSIQGTSVSVVSLSTSFSDRTFPLIYPYTVTIKLSQSSSNGINNTITPTLSGPFSHSNLIPTTLNGIGLLGYDLMNNLIGSTLSIDYNVTNYNAGSSNTLYTISLGDFALVLFPNDAYNFLNGDVTVNNGKLEYNSTQMPSWLKPQKIYTETQEEEELISQIKTYAQTNTDNYIYMYNVTGYSSTNNSTIKSSEGLFDINVYTGVISMSGNISVGNYIIWIECTQYTSTYSATGNVYTIPIYLDVVIQTNN